TDVNFQGKNLDTVKVWMSGGGGRGKPTQDVQRLLQTQGSSLHVGSDLLKFMEPVTMQESGTFVFRTPKLSHDANETLPLHLYV
ncbi:PLXNB2 isoform 8, partial [Pan troglodytes]